MRGRFITLEGIDGAGKSTHHHWLVERLRELGKPVVSTREPGGTDLGEKLRALLLSEPMHLETETLLMFAARREHLDKVIEPSLVRGEWVVSDRFTDSSYAYQGGGRGLTSDRLAILEAWVHPALKPDLTFLFDIDPAIAQRRLAATGASADRFEAERSDFFARVRAAYLRRVREYPARFSVIDAGESPEAIKVKMEETVARFCL